MSEAFIRDFRKNLVFKEFICINVLLQRHELMHYKIPFGRIHVCNVKVRVHLGKYYGFF